MSGQGSRLRDIWEIQPIQATVELLFRSILVAPPLPCPFNNWVWSVEETRKPPVDETELAGLLPLPWPFRR